MHIKYFSFVCCLNSWLYSPFHFLFQKRKYIFIITSPHQYIFQFIFYLIIYCPFMCKHHKISQLIIPRCSRKFFNFSFIESIYSILRSVDINRILISGSKIHHENKYNCFPSHLNNSFFFGHLHITNL